MKKMLRISCALATLWLLFKPVIGHSNEIEIPGINVINKEAGSVVTHLFGDSFSNTATYPKQIILDFEKDKISGLIAIYDISVGVDKIAGLLDAKYGNYRGFSNDEAPIYNWRIIDKKVLVSLSVNKENDIQLILIPMI